MKNQSKLIKPAAHGIPATLLVVIIIAAVFIGAYACIYKITRDRSILRMEESVDTVIEEVSTKLKRDSSIIRAPAKIISQSESFSEEDLTAALQSIEPLFTTMRMHILLPGDRVISPGGVSDVAGQISFENEAALGEHLSDRTISVTDGNTMVLRHFVPIEADGTVEALLYGVTILENLPEALNVSNIYNGTADVFIIDTATGDYIMNTRENVLGNVWDEDPEKKGEVSSSESMSDMLSGGKGYIRLKSASTGKWGYLYYAPSGVNAWSIAVYVPEEEALAIANLVRTVCIVSGAVIAAVLIIYYIWVRKKSKLMVEQTVEHAILEEKFKKTEAAEKAKTMFLSNMSHADERDNRLCHARSDAYQQQRPCA